MKSITLPTAICVAMISVPAHAGTVQSSDPQRTHPACKHCHARSVEPHTLDFSVNRDPQIQLDSPSLPLEQWATEPSIQATDQIRFQPIPSTQAQLSSGHLTTISPEQPQTFTLTSPAIRETPFLAHYPSASSPQPPLLSQAPPPQPNVTAPSPLSTRAADLAQVEPTPPAENAPDPNLETNPNLDDNAEPKDIPAEDIPANEVPSFSPLANQQFQQPTAIHLPEGTVALNFTNRLFFLPGTVEESGTAAYPNVGITWGITNSTELDLTLQVVDTGTPDQLGPFGTVIRVDNRDLTLSVKQRLWKQPDNSLAFSGVFSLGIPLTNRTFLFSNNVQSEDNSLIPALQFPFTATVSNRWQFTLSPTIAFFPDSNAVFLPLAPLDDPGSFGTTFGLTGAISYQVHPRLTLWGDAFVPFTGNNSFDRDTGLPAKAVAFNAGVRYLLNPSLGLDAFVSNTFGSKGPLALTADRDLAAVGVRLITLPSLFAANRRFADSFNRDRNGQDSPITTDGLAFFDGGTVPSQRFLFHLQGGGQGLLTALRYGLTKDLEIATFLDYIPNDVDESEQGIAVKLRFLNQEEGAPVTASGAVAVGLTNNIFDNFDNNNINGLFRQGAPRDFPLLFLTDSPEGRRFIATFTLPLHYQANDRLNFWLTPIVSFVQRSGIDLGGFNVGGSVEVIKDFSLVGELGANFLGEGNAFIGETLADRIPWSVAVRWDPSSIIGGESRINRPKLELFVTNRVGSSPFHQLRVRNQNEVTVGAGISVPF